MRAFRISRTRTSLLIVIVFTLASLRSPAQAPREPPSAATLKFEVASIRLHLSDNQHASFPTYPSNRFVCTKVPLRILIAIAFGIDSNKISGAPDLLDSQDYDVNAKVEDDSVLTHDQMEPLIQHLLEERLHLVAHRESRTVPGYALVVGKQPPKLLTHKPSNPYHNYLFPNGLDATDISMTSFASTLSRPAGRPVIDKTGIQGNYDFKLSYDAMSDPNSTLPSVFTAVQEQLGLKLESQKVPIEMLIIDHIDKIPTEN